jgi:hypothetical protein
MTAAILTAPVAVATRAALEQQCGHDVSQCDAAALNSAAVAPAACSEQTAASGFPYDDSFHVPGANYVSASTLAKDFLVSFVL